ncbi:hypothetical protein Daura_26330 [Dactylosporangium aurantiacum]|uniref:Secreted protein n=1 Tax=Dactylosporangium aurantiacum TaxID=35754 RepID=A0A9Q9IBE1_9ACTN|nr:hypothetical protein [Dactylosporangium aurantiacum]MDG6109271.1 hypothetical protein [Dactylosporangium aurantiacum]UWZ50359.1 hypothetical protein Daura_26330 [Dactylosporangium aurantiacum]
MHSTTQRFLAMASMTLAAGAIIGLGGTAASAAPAGDSSTTAVQPRPGNPGDNTNGGNTNGNTNGGNTNGRWPGGMGNGGGGRWHGTFDGHRRNNDWVQSWAVDTFRNKKACNFVGWLGEQRHLWDDSDCYRIGRNRYVLIAHQYGGRHHHHR